MRVKCPKCTAEAIVSMTARGGKTSFDDSIAYCTAMPVAKILDCPHINVAAKEAIADYHRDRR